MDEVVALAKKYGITTPYTSYLIVPDGAGAGGRARGRRGGCGPCIRVRRLGGGVRRRRRGPPALEPAGAGGHGTAAGGGVRPASCRTEAGRPGARAAAGSKKTASQRLAERRARATRTTPKSLRRGRGPRSEPTTRPSRRCAQRQQDGRAGRQARRRSVASQMQQPAQPEPAGADGPAQRRRPQLPGDRRRLDRRGLRRQDADAGRQGAERRLLPHPGAARRR